ncbi:hypothetical protein [Limosilactobacillus fastidiosus]|uniref:Surface layer protein A domain-containing protein n=1 Tax=Limosilactobacillus fastidiosus TaxID=2759855 RepID=A0A7W3YC03_9LACO|nr:hypothetical protein [Limosilactobacillus fastidiosus]MBB1062561.1 hypothetical protein [Limosilactobacillus fastidiosus]MBB1085487.1 hypothetical protein [Limosilactobacillus fastidiosus]MCD7083636.1 hypothetical protein [Limosilactobacillus fastidiosus]MCD7085941.1 hypothetical protein [Limosilactobacillus fastidiosus]MCD7114415.1 hypothetical protein [Limosilactobacillus fastidiosus]
MKKHLLSIIIAAMTLFITLTITDKTAQAMTQKSLNNHVYLVTFINSNGYTTAHQYVFFTTNGKSAYVNVTDTDQSGKPVVNKDSTKEEKAAPRTINRYLIDRKYLNKVTSKKYYKIKGNKVIINNGLITKKSTGKIEKGGKIEKFTANFSNGTQKYDRVLFQMAQRDYQYR